MRVYPYGPALHTSNSCRNVGGVGIPVDHDWASPSPPPYPALPYLLA